MRIYFFYACFGDSVSQAAQSFYYSVRKPERNRLLKRLLWVSAWVGIWNSQLASHLLQDFGSVLIKDASIINLMSGHTRFLGWAILLHPFIMLFEGVLLASRDLLFLMATYLITMILHFGIVFSPFTTTFDGVWRALFVFQLLRLTPFGFCVWRNNRNFKQEMERTSAAAVI
jgi:Na+-driven multidrug efflux pump